MWSIGICVVATFATGGSDAALSRFLDEMRAADRALVAGDGGAARAHFEVVLELAPHHTAAAYGMACALASQDAGAALEWLERAIAWGWRDADVMEWDADLAPLREHARFAAALNRIRAKPTPPLDDPSTQEHSLLSPTLVITPTPDTWFAALATRGGRVFCVQDDGAIDVLDVTSAALLRRCEPLRVTPRAIQADPSGERIAVADRDGNVTIWDVENDVRRVALDVSDKGRPIGGPHGVRIGCSPDGERLYVASRDARTIVLIDREAEIVTRVRVNGAEADLKVVWMDGGATLLHADGTLIQRRDGKSGIAIGTALETGREIVALSVSPDGAHVATAHPGRELALWELATGACTARRSFPVLDSSRQEHNVLLSLSHSPAGDRIAWTCRGGAYTGMIRAHDLSHLWTNDYAGGHFHEARPIAWSGSGARVWSAMECGGMPLVALDAATGRSVRETFGATPTIAGGHGAIAQLGGVTIFDPETGRPLWRRVPTATGAVLQVPSGHFAGDTDGSDLSLHRGDEEPEPLGAATIRILFDPKRVRAALSGVPVRQ